MATTLNSSERLKLYLLNKTVSSLSPTREIVLLWEVGGSLLLALGLTGNVLVLVVLRSLDRKKSAFFFMMSLAVSDFILLSNGLFVRWYDHLFGNYPERMLDWNFYICYLSNYFFWSSYTLSCVLTTAVNIAEATDAVLFAREAMSWARRSLNSSNTTGEKQSSSDFGSAEATRDSGEVAHTHSYNRLTLHAINAALWIFCFAVNLHVIIPMRRFKHTPKKMCGFNPYFTEKYGLNVRWAQFLLMSVLPVIIMTLCNIILLKEAAFSTVHTAYCRHRQTGVVLALFVAYVVLAAPRAAVFLISKGTLDTEWRYTQEFKDFAEISVFNLLLNSGISFYLYLLVSKDIRSEAAAVMCRRSRHPESSSCIESRTSSTLSGQSSAQSVQP